MERGRVPVDDAWWPAARRWATYRTRRRIDDVLALAVLAVLAVVQLVGAVLSGDNRNYVIPVLIAALVAVVLLQKSEGGALGIGGGGGGGGGLLSGRGTANLLTRATAVLAAAFFTTSIMLTILAQRAIAPSSIFDRPSAAGTPAAGTDGKPAETPAAPVGRGGVLDRIQGGAPAAPTGPVVPQTR